MQLLQLLHGGQPMQVYYMHKDGISVGSSMFTLLINITIVLFVTIALSLFNLIFNYQYMTTGLLIFFIFGTFINTCAIVLFSVGMFSEKIRDKIVVFVKKLVVRHYEKKINRIERLRLPNAEALVDKAKEKSKRRVAKIEEQADKYREDSVMVKKNKNIIIKTTIIYFIQYTVFYIISYWAYRAVGLNEHSWFEIASLQSIVYATVSGIPSPGAVGVSEAAYLGLFGKVIPENLISSVMLLVRCMNFYVFVAIAGIVVIIASIRLKKKEYI